MPRIIVCDHIHKKGLETGHASLRRMQYAAAQAGNPTMLIWLGKQHLEQKDQSRQEVTGKDGAPLIPASGLSDEEVERRAREILAKRKR